MKIERHTRGLEDCEGKHSWISYCCTVSTTWHMIELKGAFIVFMSERDSLTGCNQRLVGVGWGRTNGDDFILKPWWGTLTSDMMRAHNVFSPRLKGLHIPWQHLVRPCMFVRMCVSAFVSVYACMHVCEYVCVSVCLCGCMCETERERNEQRCKSALPFSCFTCPGSSCSCKSMVYCMIGRAFQDRWLHTICEDSVLRGTNETQSFTPMTVSSILVKLIRYNLMEY